VEACLSFDPDQRQTPAGLAHALRLVLASLPETAGHEAALLSVVAAQQTDNESLRRDIAATRQELGAVRQELGAVRQERDSAAQRFEAEIAIIRQERDATASEVAALRQELAGARPSATAAADTASLRRDLSALLEELRHTRSVVASPSFRQHEVPSLGRWNEWCAKCVN
jgi:chromosome segregation ATPase